MSLFSNLFRNVFRSLKNNKVSVIGLTFLTFLSVGLFTVLNLTASNISSEYQQISKDGNLHDFTVSENYLVGNITWIPTDEYDDGEHGDAEVISSDGKQISWPTQTQNETFFDRTYEFEAQGTAEIGEYIEYINQIGDENSAEWKIIHPPIDIRGSNIDITTSNHLEDQSTTNIDFDTTEEVYQIDWTYNEVQSDLGSIGDANEITKKQNELATELINLATTSHTPMQNYLDSNEMNDKVSWRNFKSLDVNNSPDNIYYKFVQSNPEDTIDKAYLFNSKGNNNFSINDFKPINFWLQDPSIINKTIPEQITELINFNFKDSNGDIGFEDAKNNEECHAFFALLRQGDTMYMGTDNNLHGIDTDENTGTYAGSLDDIVNRLSKRTWSNDGTDESAYKDYVDNFLSTTLTVSHDYMYTIQWTGAVPHSWTMSDWTAKFAVVSPTYLDKHKLHPYSIDNREQLINQLNSATEGKQREDFIQNVIDANPSSVIMNSQAVNVPFIVIGAGITADFIYPIINIQYSTPNPQKECIIFGNSNAYERIFQSYRSNPTENYLVGKFAKGVNGDDILNQINNKAKEVMNWPINVRAAYMANDTTNYLNASAFRIAYIPNLVDKIEYVDYALTIFVLILSLFICGIVIKRYIDTCRIQIGIMRANGIKKRHIAFSLAPFSILPAVVGGLGGYIIGILLQNPAIGLFKNYWMIPTPFGSFNVLISLVAIFIPFLVFMLVSILATLILLREKTTDLMKQGSEYHATFISRHVKKPFDRFNIITRFRVSIAFNSFWKLITLIVMASLSMTTLVFGISEINKFEYAKNMTFNSRNYTYAIDLYSPTAQGGQYIPVSADDNALGRSGFINTTSEGNNWMPNLYYDDEFRNYDGTYATIFGDDDTFGIPKMYYESTYELFNLIEELGPYAPGDIQKAMIDDEGNVHGAGFLPMMSDSAGETYDLQFTKNRTMIKNFLDFNVGALGMTTNPWGLANSLMPENNRNLCDGRSELIIQWMGEASHDIGSPIFNSKLYDMLPIDPKDDFFKYDCDAKKWFVNKENCLPKAFNSNLRFGICLAPDFIKFLIEAYKDLIISNQSLLDLDYAIEYDKVPLKSTDETYTYIDATNQWNDNVKITGIKDNTQYVNLTDTKGRNLLNLLSTDKIKNDTAYHPIIVNEFAAYKHNLNVGSTLTFTINNKTDRIEKLIAEDDHKSSVTFKVVGINSTYEGEEYFTNQQLANKLIGLRSTLPDSPWYFHNWYISSEIATETEFAYHQYQKQYKLNDEDGQQAQEGQLIDLANIDENEYAFNPAKSFIEHEEDTYGNVIPYGFNGVFTDQKNGSSILNGGMFLYSPSGIYPGTDAIDANNTFLNVLKQGPNLQIANIIMGMKNTTIGQQINNAYTTWQNDVSTTQPDATLQQDFSDYISYANEFVENLFSIYGKTSVVSLVQMAMDRDSTALIFDNLSSTITQTEQTIIAIVTIMVIIIVMLVTIILISDAKRLAAILKTLGYNDRENALNFLAIYLPVLLFGLMISIPLAIAAVHIFQALIFNGANILLSTSVPWWSYLVGVGAIMTVLSVSGLGGYYSLRKERLPDALKE